METYDKLYNSIVEKLNQIYPELKEISLDLKIEPTPDKSLGDFGFDCFFLAKLLKKDPKKIAENIRDKILPLKLVKKIEVKGAFVNLTFKKTEFIEDVINTVLTLNFRYGSNDTGKNEKIMIEYSAPNTNKPQHLGHVRNNVLGMSLSKIYQKSGFDVVKVNLINDRGIHITKSMLAYMKWGEGKTPSSKKKKGDHFVGDFYVLFEQKAKEEPNLLNEAYELLRKWEKGDEQVQALWRKMNKWVYRGFQKTYSRLGCKFDKVYYESNTYKYGKKIVLQALEKGICRRNHKGEVVVDLSQKELGTKVLLRSDGTSVYITQDIGTTKLKFDDYSPDLSIFVVASEQIFHFKVLFSILKELGFEWADNCYHLAYGMVYLPEGKMKSREGKVVEADELMNQMKSMVKKEIKKRDRDFEKKEFEKISEQVGIGAIKYFMLKVHPQKDIHFNPEESINFEGDTGPYLQYTYARIASVIRKSDKSDINIDKFTELGNEDEMDIAGQIFQFKKYVLDAVMSKNPSRISVFLYDLARNFNKFYNKHSILSADTEKLCKERLMLTKAVGILLKEGLDLLGIETPERM